MLTWCQHVVARGTAAAQWAPERLTTCPIRKVERPTRHATPPHGGRASEHRRATWQHDDSSNNDVSV